MLITFKGFPENLKPVPSKNNIPKPLFSCNLKVFKKELVIFGHSKIIILKSIQDFLLSTFVEATHIACFFFKYFPSGIA
jgi:hypothetical protein